METYNDENIKYLEARRRMKEIKGFYIHFFIYLLINLFTMMQYLMTAAPGTDLKEGVNLYTGLLWGIVIIIHALSIFLPGIKQWEWKKTIELMNKHPKTKNYGRF